VVRAQRRDRVILARIGAQALARGWSEEAILAELSRPEALVVALHEADGRDPQGFLLARRGVGELHLLLVAVAVGARRRGGGSVLLAAALEVARREGLRAVHLEVRAGNAPALDFYLHHGFVAVGRRPRYYEDREDALLMTLHLEGGDGG
jgi:ribosomal-protein-alanine N-acetyltransferase